MRTERRKAPSRRGTVPIIVPILVLLLLLAAILLLPEIFPPPAADMPQMRELPARGPDDVVVLRSGYALAYDEMHEQAAWVAYELTREEAAGGFERSDDFREDPMIPTGSATLPDYRRSGFDRGHLAPAADMAWSEEAMRDSFFLSNISPQDPSFNRGIWRRLEELVRDWAIDEGSVLVVTGPVLTDGPFDTIGPEGVSVPKRFYKVILDDREPERKAIGFLLPNRASSEPLAVFAVPVDRIEAVTGIDFFPALPDPLEERLESKADPGLWDLTVAE